MGSAEIVEVTGVPEAYLKEEGIRTLALHLRDDGNAAAKLSRNASLKSAHGGLEKRVVYFKGRDFVNFMLNKVTRNKVKNRRPTSTFAVAFAHFVSLYLGS